MSWLDQIVRILAQLFKANNVGKIYIKWYADTLKFFAEKMWVAFAVQKLLTFFFFSEKNIRLLCIESVKQLTKWPLMSTLS